MEQKFDNDNDYIRHGHPVHEHARDRETARTGSGVTFWLVIGVVVLIILLILWLTIADLWGDTDVAARLTDLASVSGSMMQNLL